MNNEIISSEKRSIASLRKISSFMKVKWSEKQMLIQNKLNSQIIQLKMNAK